MSSCHTGAIYATARCLASMGKTRSPLILPLSSVSNKVILSSFYPCHECHLLENQVIRKITPVIC
jgi:hypothetical protein